MQDGGEDEAVIVWLKLCEEEIEVQNKDLSDTPYSKNELESSMQRLKMIALNPDVEGSIKSARKLLNRCGVYLVVRLLTRRYGGPWQAISAIQLSTSASVSRRTTTSGLPLSMS